MKKKVDIVIPVYNNGHELEDSVEELYNFLSKNFEHDWKIIIANNASKDNTLQVAKQLSEKYPKVTFTHTDVQGRGNALTKDWLNSDADIVSYMDVDLATRLDAFPALIGLIADEKTHITTGSRYHNKSKIKRLPMRYFLSWGYNLLTRLYLGAKFKDAQCGFKAMSNKAAQEILPLVKDGFWFWDTEMMYIAQKMGYKVTEVPVTWTEDPDSGVKIIKTVTSFFKKLHELRNRKI